MFLFFNEANVVVSSNTGDFSVTSVEKLDSSYIYNRENYNKWNKIDNPDGSVSFFFIETDEDGTNKFYYLDNSGAEDYVLPMEEKANFVEIDGTFHHQNRDGTVSKFVLNVETENQHYLSDRDIAYVKNMNFTKLSLVETLV